MKSASSTEFGNRVNVWIRPILLAGIYGKVAELLGKVHAGSFRSAVGVLESLCPHY